MKKTSHPPHENREFVSVSTTIQFNRGTKVEWKARKHPVRTDRDNTAYQVTITRGPSGSLPFSLFTLAIQAIGFEVHVKNPSSTKKVTLIKPDGTLVQLDATGREIPRTHKAGGDVNPAGIWFIDFTGGTCKLEVEAVNRPKAGETEWGGPGTKSGHDNMPPGGTTEK